MPLIIEDGSGVPDANSYVTVAEARAFAAQRGVTLPTDDTELEVMAVKAADWLEAQRSRFKGKRVSPLQALQWPRSGVTLEDDYEVPEDSIPSGVKNAQCAIINELASGTDVLPNDSGRTIIREKVDVLETEYAADGSGASQPVFTKVEALLEPFLLDGTANGAIGRLEVSRG